MKVNMLRVPCISVAESEQFYSEVLGLTKSFGCVADGFIGFQLDNVQLLLEREEKGEFESGRFLGFSLEVEDISALYNRLSAKGITFTGVPKPQFWGGIMTHIIDSSNNTFSIVEMRAGKD